MVAKRGSPSCRHQSRSPRRSPDRPKQQTRCMTPMFCPLPKGYATPDKIAFAMFKTTGSERENAAARDYITQAGYIILDGEVSVSTAYGSASDQGKAITETSFRSLNDRASKLAQSVIDRMVELREKQVA